ncbi:MAG: alpha/beta hydrolase [Anaerolineae bacterium]
METQLTHATIFTNGVNLHVVQAGPEDGPLVILLHGFPDFWYGWRKQIDYLVAQGYRVWAPDQRGYNLSDKPQAVAAYTLDQTSDDVVGLLQTAGVDKAYIVGHDWGAAVAWHFSQRYPELVRKMVILNVPHNGVFRRYLLSHWKQMLRSWYILYIQLPFLPQWTISMLGWRVFSNIFHVTSNPGSYSSEDIKEYRAAWVRTGDGSSMLAWYRAAVQVRVQRLPSHASPCPH